jgi:sugar lactone lactonase YvrE
LPDVVGLAFNRAGDLFVSSSLGTIYKFTPGGTQSTFASGLTTPIGLAFNGAGNLFVADAGPGISGTITEITPGGTKSTFASGLNYPEGLTFNSAGNLFVATEDGQIYEYSTGGTQSTFVSGLSNLAGIAFQGETLPVPEPSTLWMLVAGAFILPFYRLRMNYCQ